MNMTHTQSDAIAVITLLLMATTHKKLNTPHYMLTHPWRCCALMMIGGIYNNMYARRFRKTMLPQIGRSAMAACAHVCVCSL